LFLAEVPQVCAFGGEPHFHFGLRIGIAAPQGHDRRIVIVAFEVSGRAARGVRLATATETRLFGDSVIPEQRTTFLKTMEMSLLVIGWSRGSPGKSHCLGSLCHQYRRKIASKKRR
jgi:hypothetical protein